MNKICMNSQIAFQSAKSSNGKTDHIKASSAVIMDIRPSSCNVRIEDNGQCRTNLKYFILHYYLFSTNI